MLVGIAYAALVQAGERKVLTIAIDGLRPDALLVANAPNIDSLVDGTFFGTSGSSGIFPMHAQSEHLTFSGPGWGSYMTGLHVDRHGADTNGFENVVPGTTDWFTPLEAFDPTLNTHRVITWVIAHTSIPSGADTADVYEYSSNGDQLMTNRVVQLMQDPDTDVVMTFFSDVDAAGHSCGFSPTAACYLAEIASTDAQIGQIMTAMEARPDFANEDWLVILTSDHGGSSDGSHHGGTPEKRTIPFIVAGPLATTVIPQANPRQPDVAATVLTYFGAPLPANYDGHPVGLAPAGPAPAIFGQNLVFNGDAEFNRGFDSNAAQQYAAGWNNPGPGGVTTINYLAGGGFPSPTDPGPADRGNNFFSGGVNAVSTMTQRIDVSNLAGMIDADNVDFILSAWLGGYLSQNDRAAVVAHFLDNSSAQIGSAQLAAVTNLERGNATGLLLREQLGDLPATTRFIEIELIATRAVGENDGYADNIALIIALTGDLNFDGSISAADWVIFRSGQHVNMSGFTRSAALGLGDLNGDFRNDFTDFVMFKAAFESLNGQGSFAAMLRVPEPSAMVLLTAAGLTIACRIRRRRNRRQSRDHYRIGRSNRPIARIA
jgi:hypothetical protein